MGKRHPVGFYHDEWVEAHHPDFQNWPDFLEAYASRFPGEKSAVKMHCKRSLGIDYPDQREQYDEEWIERNWEEEKNWNRLTDRYNRELGKNVSYAAFKSYCNRHLGLNFKYTEEQKEWLKTNFPAIGKNEIGKRFNERFGAQRTGTAVYVECKKLGLKVNEERRTEWRQRIAGVRKQEVGTVMPREHGKLYIKTESGWKRCDELVIGRKRGKIIVHLDGDQKNLNRGNLIHIDRKISAIMTAERFWSNDSEVTKSGIEWSRLKIALKERGIEIEQFDYAE